MRLSDRDTYILYGIAFSSVVLCRLMFIYLIYSEEINSNVQLRHVSSITCGTDRVVNGVLASLMFSLSQIK
jgi:hypothetical protein